MAQGREGERVTDGEMWGLALQYARARNVDAMVIHGRTLSLAGFSAIMEEWYVPARAPRPVIQPGNGINGGLKITWPDQDVRDEVERFIAEIEQRERRRWGRKER